MGEQLLRKALRWNAVFSAFGGLVALMASDMLSGPLGVPTLVLAAIGAGLLLWAGLVWTWARRDPVRHPEAWTVVAGDVLWVLASVAVLILRPGSLTEAGWWMVAVLAVAVADFAVIQTVALRKIRT